MDGIIIVNKPKNLTSNNVVNRVKHILNCKVGHTGTLDPNATGVLPLLLGDGTKLSKYLMNHDKKYCATLKLGEKTSTADVEGEVIATKPVDDAIFSDTYINGVFSNFVGEQIQKPPMYSAIKINGKKLYDYARKGIEVDVPTRNIVIYNLELLSFDATDKTICFNVECSKGTYIRSLCEDIAEKLGTVGYMRDLDRLKVGEFTIEQSVTIEELEQNAQSQEWIETKVLSFEDVMKDYPAYELPTNKLTQFLNGVKIADNNVKDGVYRIYCEGVFLGSAVAESRQIKRDIILNND